MSDAGSYDPLSTDAKLNNQAYYQRLRAGCPVHHHRVPDSEVAKQNANYMVAAPTTEFWSVFRYADAVGILQDKENFSAREGPGPERMATTVTPDGTLLFADAPAHTRQRQIANKAFLPRMVAQREPATRQAIDDLIDELGPRGEADLMQDIGFPVGVAMITEMFGVGADRGSDITRWGVTAIEGFGGTPEMVEAAGKATMSLFALVMEEVAARRAIIAGGGVLQDDTLSALITAEHEGHRFTDEEILEVSFQFLTAGYESTATSIGSGVRLLCEHPEQRAKLEADWSLLDTCVEEILRFESPVEGLFRTTRNPVAVGGVDLPAGAKVRVVFASANRDDERFADAGEFRIDRPAADLRRHLAFGTGQHACLGSALARMQLRVLLETLLRRLPGVEVDRSRPWVRAKALTVNGHTHLPIRWDPSATRPRLWS